MCANCDVDRECWNKGTFVERCTSVWVRLSCSMYLIIFLSTCSVAKVSGKALLVFRWRDRPITLFLGCFAPDISHTSEVVARNSICSGNLSFICEVSWCVVDCFGRWTSDDVLRPIVGSRGLETFAPTTWLGKACVLFNMFTLVESAGKGLPKHV